MHNQGRCCGSGSLGLLRAALLGREPGFFQILETAHVVDVPEARLLQQLRRFSAPVAAGAVDDDRPVARQPLLWLEPREPAAV